MDLYMNTVFVCLLYGVNIALIFYSDNIGDILMNSLAIEVVASRSSPSPSPSLRRSRLRRRRRSALSTSKESCHACCCRCCSAHDDDDPQRIAPPKGRTECSS
jgi:hypothetical protein